MSHHYIHIKRIYILLFVALLSIISLGCQRRTKTLSTSISRSVARSSQAMAQSAQLGSLATGDTVYSERDPNPNAYVGELLFKRYCSPCHGNGKAPEILEKRLTPPDAESDFYIIRYGLIDMKGFRSRLTTFQILDILAYMKVDLSNFNPGKRDLSLKESKKTTSQSTTQTDEAPTDEPEDAHSETTQ